MLQDTFYLLGSIYLAFRLLSFLSGIALGVRNTKLIINAINKENNEDDF